MSGEAVFDEAGRQLYGLDAETYLKVQSKRDHAYERKVLEWVKATLKGKYDGFFDEGDIWMSLKSGVCLCLLVNHLKPKSIPKFAQTGLKPLVEMDNIQLFLKALWSLGVPSGALFNTSDLYQKKSLPSVISSIVALSNLAKKKKWKFKGKVFSGKPSAQTAKPYNGKKWKTKKASGKKAPVPESKLREEVKRLQAELADQQQDIRKLEGDKNSLQYEVARLKKGGGKAGGGGGGGKPKSGIFKAFGSMGKGKSKKREEEEVRLVRSELAKERRLREEDKAKHVRELDAVQRQHSQALKRAAAATTDDGREGGVVEAATAARSGDGDAEEEGGQVQELKAELETTKVQVQMLTDRLAQVSSERKAEKKRLLMLELEVEDARADRDKAEQRSQKAMQAYRRVKSSLKSKASPEGQGKAARKSGQAPVAAPVAGGGVRQEVEEREEPGRRGAETEAMAEKEEKKVEKKVEKGASKEEEGFVARVRVVHPLQGTGKKDLDLVVGQVIGVTKRKGDSSWWTGVVLEGEGVGLRGKFPNTYVEVLQPASGVGEKQEEEEEEEEEGEEEEEEEESDISEEEGEGGGGGAEAEEEDDELAPELVQKATIKISAMLEGGQDAAVPAGQGGRGGKGTSLAALGGGDGGGRDTMFAVMPLIKSRKGRKLFAYLLQNAVETNAAMAVRRSLQALQGGGPHSKGHALFPLLCIIKHLTQHAVPPPSSSSSSPASVSASASASASEVDALDDLLNADRCRQAAAAAAGSSTSSSPPPSSFTPTAPASSRFGSIFRVLSGKGGGAKGAKEQTPLQAFLAEPQQRQSSYLAALHVRQVVMLLKHLLGEGEPLFSFAQYEPLVTLARCQKLRPVRVASFRDAVRCLLPQRQLALARLFDLFAVLRHRGLCSAEQLAYAFGPSLLRPRVVTQEHMLQMTYINSIVLDLQLDSFTIFHLPSVALRPAQFGQALSLVNAALREEVTGSNANANGDAAAGRRRGKRDYHTVACLVEAAYFLASRGPDGNMQYMLEFVQRHVERLEEVFFEEYFTGRLVEAYKSRQSQSNSSSSSLGSSGGGGSQEGEGGLEGEGDNSNDEWIGGMLEHQALEMCSLHAAPPSHLTQAKVRRVMGALCHNHALQPQQRARVMSCVEEVMQHLTGDHMAIVDSNASP